MMNGLQLVDYWQDYFNHPAGSLLGLFNCIYSVGNIAALPFAYVVPDKPRGILWVGLLTFSIYADRFFKIDLADEQP
jgi:hypothetical protein